MRKLWLWALAMVASPTFAATWDVRSYYDGTEEYSSPAKTAAAAKGSALVLCGRLGAEHYRKTPAEVTALQVQEGKVAAIRELAGENDSTYFICVLERNDAGGMKSYVRIVSQK